LIDFIDLFSGIGGFRLGLERANNGVGAKLTAGKRWHQDQKGLSADSGSKDGNRRKKHTDDRGRFTCVWSCDWNKYANQVYTKQFGEENHYSGDIRGVDPGDIPDFDLLCAGFPCQSFSVAGKRKGFQDTRGTVFFEICRIAEAKRPSLLLLENVKGLLSSGRGQVFYTIIQSLEDLGYWVEWQVLNSKYFGVPQNRERVFIVGHLRGTGGREIFPIGEADGMAQRKAKGKREQISLAIDRNYWKGPDKHGQRTVIGISFTNPHNPHEERGVNLSHMSRAVKPPYGNQQPLVLADRTRTLAGKGRNLESPKLITNALSGVQKDKLILENLMIRRLTPVECERLQGFPDGWTEGLSDTQRYKCLGNAVTVNVITFLGKRIMEAKETVSTRARAEDKTDG